tara:strand:+ start:950 stop:1219 length:270 start_codon:yes stop_codon:yes gene_type:complete
MTDLHDFRGNTYQGGAKLGIPCSVDACEEEAVRHSCNAERDPYRTHWHGEIHSLADGGSPKPYCDVHGQEVLASNKRHLEGRVEGGRQG